MSGKPSLSSSMFDLNHSPDSSRATTPDDPEFRPLAPQIKLRYKDISKQVIWPQCPITKEQATGRYKRGYLDVNPDPRLRAASTYRAHGNHQIVKVRGDSVLSVQPRLLDNFNPLRWSGRRNSERPASTARDTSALISKKLSTATTATADDRNERTIFYDEQQQQEPESQITRL